MVMNIGRLLSCCQSSRTTQSAIEIAMDTAENAVDAAIQFVGPFLGKSAIPQQELSDLPRLLEESISHLAAINAAEETAEPDAPYDASLVGVVYGLLDLICSIGILPYLSHGAAFGQRPQSVLKVPIPIHPSSERTPLFSIVNFLVSILEQDGSGVQPLLSQRIFPDVLSGLAELSFSPHLDKDVHDEFLPMYDKLLIKTPISRLLPVFTALLQQDVPDWWKPRLAQDLTMIPLRPHGVRHTIEFLALSYLSKNSQVPQDASGSQTKLPLPLESITQTARLLSAVPIEMTQNEWFNGLAPQLLALLDGSEGKELSRAAGQIIAGGILNKKSTGAPRTVGWELFAKPLLESICPGEKEGGELCESTVGQVLVDEKRLRLALSRLATITSSYSHSGLLKRLVGPIILPLWGLTTYSSSRPSLDKGWSELPRAIILRYLALACEAPRIALISDNIFWGGESAWTYAPGSQGGIEIRMRPQASKHAGDMEGLFGRIASVEKYVGILVALLREADIEDALAGAIFIQSTKKWLSPHSQTTPSLTVEPDTDPLSALVAAKLSESLATHFKEKFARSPQHVVELMGQLLQNFASEHRNRIKGLENSNRPSREILKRLTHRSPAIYDEAGDVNSEDLVSFAISILSTLLSSPDFKRTPQIADIIEAMLPSIRYLANTNHNLPLITNAATNLLQLVQPTSVSSTAPDPQLQHRVTLQNALEDLASPEPPIHVWALSTIRRLVEDPVAFPIIDVPSLTHALLSTSVADAESYVHTASVPVVVSLAVRASNPTIRILVEAFTDTDERSLGLKKEREVEEALDFRLRVGEILDNFLAEDAFWDASTGVGAKYASVKLIVEAILSVASRRGRRKQTLGKRDERTRMEQRQQEEGEAAWGGPIPNLLDPAADDVAEQAERDALFKVVQGWEDTGLEEDVRVRTSAMSVLRSVMERRLGMLGQVAVDAALQMVLLIVTMETSEAKGILRRAAVLVIMGLLKGMDGMLEDGRESAAGLGLKQMEEVERVMQWATEEDTDGLVRDHAGSVVEGMETWRMNKLYRVRDAVPHLEGNLSLEGHVRGLTVQPLADKGGRAKKGLVEEIE